MVEKTKKQRSQSQKKANERRNTHSQTAAERNEKHAETQQHQKENIPRTVSLRLFLLWSTEVWVNAWYSSSGCLNCTLTRAVSAAASCALRWASLCGALVKMPEVVPACSNTTAVLKGTAVAGDTHTERWRQREAHEHKQSKEQKERCTLTSARLLAQQLKRAHKGAHGWNR